jgi:hypothetical protein
MDDDFILVVVIASIVIGLTALLIWMKSRGRRQVVDAITQVQESLKLTLFVGTHSQLDSVWMAVRGQVSGVTIRIFGGKTGGTFAKANPIDRAFVLVVVTLPSLIPFRCSMQRRSALSTPRFGTSYVEFDKLVEVTTDNEKKALTLLNHEQLRDTIVSFIKPTSNAYITSSEIMIKISGDRQILPIAREAITIATLLGNQLKKMAEEEKSPKKDAGGEKSQKKESAGRNDFM